MLIIVAGFLLFVSIIALVTRPIAGLALIFIARPFVDATFSSSVIFGFTLTKIMSGIVPIIILGHILVARGESSLRYMPLKNIWLIYITYTLFFSLIIIYTEGVMSGIDVFLRYLNGFAGFYMVQAFVRKPKDLKIYIWALIIAGIFPMGVGLYEIVFNVHWTYAQSEGLIRYIGLYHDAFTPRYYALQTLMGLFLFLTILYRKQIVLFLCSSGYALITLAVMYKTYSKSAIVILSSWFCIWVYEKRKIGLLLTVVVLGVLVSLYYSQELIEELYRMFHKEIGALEGTGNIERSFAGRWYGWEILISEWAEFDLFQKIFGSGVVAKDAHNDYLQMLFHGGIVGLSIYLSLLGAVLFKILQNLFQDKSVLNIAALMAFSMWFVDAIGLVPSIYPGYQWFIWGTIGLCLRQHYKQKKILRLESRYAAAQERMGGLQQGLVNRTPPKNLGVNSGSGSPPRV